MRCPREVTFTKYVKRLTSDQVEALHNYRHRGKGNVGVAAYGATLASLGRSGDIESMRTVEDWMHEDGVQENIFVINALLKSCKSLYDLERRLQTMKDLNLSPTVHTHTVAVRQLMQHNEKVAAKLIFREVEDPGTPLVVSILPACDNVQEGLSIVIQYIITRGKDYTNSLATALYRRCTTLHDVELVDINYAQYSVSNPDRKLLFSRFKALVSTGQYPQALREITSHSLPMIRCVPHLISYLITSPYPGYAKVAEAHRLAAAVDSHRHCEALLYLYSTVPSCRDKVVRLFKTIPPESRTPAVLRAYRTALINHNLFLLV
eukprot:TRINITY_DN22413_c0_g1_i1.p1 TRINITY_DN22413_c0_g1~~TRINITY_DN22413_c0_g1_i1.p1  ORF type:complete len:320 (+),score=59.65 TRINITY_DN22413_c0_g1_i1:60-1019(+)